MCCYTDELRANSSRQSRYKLNTLTDRCLLVFSFLVGLLLTRYVRAIAESRPRLISWPRRSALPLQVLQTIGTTTLLPFFGTLSFYKSCSCIRTPCPEHRIHLLPVMSAATIPHWGPRPLEFLSLWMLDMQADCLPWNAQSLEVMHPTLIPKKH